MFELSRRQLLQHAAHASTAALVAGGAALVALPSKAQPAQALRPPGALEEDAFLSACVRCGLCVRSCPPQNLKLADWGRGLEGVGVGTPYFEARDIPCEMCEAIPCVKACPTEALDRELAALRHDLDRPEQDDQRQDDQDADCGKFHDNLSENGTVD